MLRPGVAAAAGAWLVACGGGEDDPAAELSRRVAAVLDDQPEALGVGDVRDAEVACPPVREPEAGDRATCRVELRDGEVVEVDLEFQDDGAIVVVAVVP